jgi:HEAT repeat protein
MVFDLLTLDLQLAAMDATLKSLIGLLDDGDVETRCAALLVLTRLGAADAGIVRKVGALLGGRNVVLRDFALGYFESARPPDGIPHLLPALDSHEDPLRLRAAAILAAYGPSGVAAVRKLVDDAPRRRLNAIIDVAARVRSGAALDLLYGLLPSDDFDTSRAACDALVATIPELTPKGRDDLLDRTTELAAKAKGRRTALVAAAKLFGALANPKARRALFAMLGEREPHVVRTHALGALVQCLRGQKLGETEIRALLPLLGGNDEQGVLRPTVRLLEDQDLDRAYLAELNRLAESAQPVVKRFAVQKLGGFESAGVVKTLIGYLADDSYARRDQAASSLKALPAARAALMKELLACDDERLAWTLGEILLTHDRAWKRDVVDGLWKRLETAIEKREDRLFSPYFHFLSAIDGEKLAGRIRERADRLRKGKKFAPSARWLALLKDSPAFDAEAQFAFALADLKAHRHKMGGVVRRHDAALETFRRLAPTPFPLAERLRRERLVTPEELYVVAFQLAESRGEERAVARELLEHLADKVGRTNVGKAARNKLRLLGSDER